jgi:hypothetical protein
MKTLRLDIFKPGTHLSMSGEEIAFGEDELKAIAAAYDPACHEAPVVLGHPKTDDPAYGWVKSLAFADGALVADLGDLDPEFAEALEKRRYAQRSPAFYAPASKGNPKPGAWMLRHLGFLGAAVPGCKGLKALSFMAEDEMVAFAGLPGEVGWGFDAAASLFRSLRDWLIEDKGIETADRLLPSWSLRSLDDAARAVREAVHMKDQVTAAFTEGAAMQAEAEAARNALGAMTARAETAEAELARRIAAQAAAEDQAFVEGLVREGRLAPGRKAETLALLVATDGSEAVAFSEGGPAKTRKQALKEHLAAAPKLIAFGEAAGGKDVPDAALKPEELARQAQAYQDEQALKGVFISAAQAVQHVKKGSKA